MRYGNWAKSHHLSLASWFKAVDAGNVSIYTVDLLPGTFRRVSVLNLGEICIYLPGSQNIRQWERGVKEKLEDVIKMWLSDGF